eukprot:scaffold721_cov131-Cylindrotheca_fusiformis.AAC.9
MKKVISSILFAVLGGAAAAFFRPALPYQVEVEAKPEFFPRGGASINSALDNADIEEDTNISPARKCEVGCILPPVLEVFALTMVRLASEAAQDTCGLLQTKDSIQKEFSSMCCSEGDGPVVEPGQLFLSTKTPAQNDALVSPRLSTRC